MADKIVYVVFAVLILYVSHSFGDDDHGNQVLSLTKDSFNDAISSIHHFVMFYAPWCGHCKRLAPTWDELSGVYNKLEDSPVKIAKVDCTEETPLCAEHDVTGYPTLKYFKNPEDFVRFKGDRGIASLKSFIEEQHSKKDTEEVPQEQPEPKEGLVELEADIDDAIKFGNFFVKFYAPWCGHCKRLAPVWEELAQTYEDNQDITIAKIDCDAHGSACSAYSIQGYPTLIYFSNGKNVAKYSGMRTHDDLKEFVDQQLGQGVVDQERTEDKVPDEIEPESAMIELTDETYEEYINSPLIFIKYYAPWCGHCRKLAPTWIELSKKYSEQENVVIADMDCTKFPDICKNNQVRGYPTLILFRNSVKVEEYSGPRSLDNLYDFVEAHRSERDEL